MINILNVPTFKVSLNETVNFCRECRGEVDIIVPDKLSLFMEKFLFESLGIESSFNLKVYTLNRFAKRNSPVAKDKQISKVGSIILIHKILNENIDSLLVMKSKAYSFSYAEEIYSTIAQLKASKITYEDMVKFESDNIQLQDKIHDLALVFEEYETGKAGLLDASDQFLMSTMSVADGVEGKKVVFVGFDDFTAIEYSIIERLAVATDVYVMNYASQNSNKYIYNSEVVSQLKNIAYINELPFKLHDISVREDNILSTFLEKNLYGIANNSFSVSDDSIRIMSGGKIRSELEFVARDIRKKILSGGRYSDFGVAVFNMAQYSSIIK